MLTAISDRTNKKIILISNFFFFCSTVPTMQLNPFGKSWPSAPGWMTEFRYVQHALPYLHCYRLNTEHGDKTEYIHKHKLCFLMKFADVWLTQFRQVSLISALDWWQTVSTPWTNEYWIKSNGLTSKNCLSLIIYINAHLQYAGRR